MGRYCRRAAIPAITVVLTFMCDGIQAQLMCRAVEAMRWILHESTQAAEAFMALAYALPRMLAMVPTDSELGRCGAVLALAELCLTHEPTRVAVIQSPHLNLLIRMVKTGTEPQVHASLLLLAAMLSITPSDGEYKEALSVLLHVMETRQLPLLLCVKIKQRLCRPLTYAAALHCLTVLAFHNEDIRAMLIDEGCMPHLLSSVESDPEPQCSRATETLSQVLRYTPSRAEAIALGAVPILAARLDAEKCSPTSMAEAALSLAFLADTREYREEIGEAAMYNLSRLVLPLCTFSHHPFQGKAGVCVYLL